MSTDAINEKKLQKSRVAASRLAQSALNGAPLSSSTLLLILGSQVGSILFTVVYLIEGATRPGYNAWRLPVSALSLGPGGWVQQANFVLFGLILLFILPATRKILKNGVGETAYPILRAINGISFIMLGLFSQDPAQGYPLGSPVLTTPTMHGTIHILFSFISFIVAASSCFVLARRFSKEPRWRGWTLYSLLTGLLMIVFVALYGTMSAHNGPISGVFERLSGGVDSLWSLLLVIKLFKIQRETKSFALPVQPAEA